MNTLEGQKEVCKRPQNYRKSTEVVEPCEENERGAHSEKNARCGQMRSVERGQHSKQAAWRKMMNSYTGDLR